MQISRIGINIYVFLLLACALLELTIVSGLVLSLFRTIAFVWSFYYYIKTVSNIQKEPLIIKTLTVFYLLLAIYGFLVVLEGKTFQVGMREVRKVVTLSYIVKVSWSLLPIFVFYNYAKKRLLTKQYILKWLFTFAIVAIVCYFFMLQASQLKMGEEEVTNNGGYLILSFVPLFLFMKTRSWLQYAFFAGAMLLVLLSIKRGAILVGLMCTAVYFLYIFWQARRSALFGVVIALVLGFYGSYTVFEQLSAKSDYFQKRLEETIEGDTNGRDLIQGFFLNYYFNESTTKEKLIGGGANATLELFGMYAHNDWLELAINQGLLGLLLYLFFWIAFIRLLFKKKVPTEVKCCLVMLFVIYFLKTWFSMSYTEYTLYSSMAFGYCIAMSSQRGDKKRIFQPNLKRRNEKSDIYHLGGAL